MLSAGNRIFDMPKPPARSRRRAPARARRAPASIPKAPPIDTARLLKLDRRLYGYLLEATSREPQLMARLRTETRRLPEASQQIGPEQAQFMDLLVRLIGARRALEIGTFTGYSALAVALALPADGKLVCCDVSEEWTAIARRYWREAGVADRIELRLAPAADTLASLLAAGGSRRFDFAFIDADKENYDLYYEQCLKLVRPGGLIAIDNTLWHGAVADPRRNDVDTVAIRALNRKIRDDARVDMVLLPIGDGLLLARPRARGRLEHQPASDS
jgi:caffeoyl-CoA O-methyltransferase